MELLGPVRAAVAKGRSQAQGRRRPQAGSRGTGAPKEPTPWLTPLGLFTGLRREQGEMRSPRDREGPREGFLEDSTSSHWFVQSFHNY